MRLGRRGRDQENDMVWGPPYEVRISHKGKESGVTFVHLYELICGHFDSFLAPARNGPVWPGQTLGSSSLGSDEDSPHQPSLPSV